MSDPDQTHPDGTADSAAPDPAAPDPAAPDPAAPDPADNLRRGVRLLDALRVFGANYAEYTRRFAAFLGLHATDASALMEILYAEDKGTPLSPARLAERIALSSGATTNLLNRLEDAGYVVRTREQADRRIVTLRSSPEIGEPARAFFGPLGEGFGRLVARHPASVLDGVEQVLDEVRGLMDEMLDVPVGERARSRPRSG